jgi:hypothetical protein
MNATILATSCLLTFGSALAHASVVTTTTLPVDHVYSVKGFDNNDNTQVMVSGYLPNPCYKAPEAKSRVEGKRIYIEVTGLRDDTPGRVCPQMIVPFLEAVSVGVLPSGSYEVEVNGGTQWAQHSVLTVSDARSSAVDDFFYANVEYIERRPDSRTVLLTGYQPTSCIRLREIRVISNERDAYAILPIMEQVSQACPLIYMPFTYEFEVPRDLDFERVLLHVRALNGKSVNAIFDNRIGR